MLPYDIERCPGLAKRALPDDYESFRLTHCSVCRRRTEVPEGVMLSWGAPVVQMSMETLALSCDRFKAPE